MCSTSEGISTTLTPSQRRRITFRRARPNVIFEQYLSELWLEAKKKNSMHEPMFRKAWESLRRYPLPLKSGAECAMLNGFTPMICLILDQCMKKHNMNREQTTTGVVDLVKIEDDDDIVCINEQTSQSTPSQSSTKPTQTTHTTQPPDKQLGKSPNEKVKNTYKPLFRSGGYGILMGLLEHAKKNTGVSLKKDDLIEIAQKYCEESFTVSRSERYSAWSSMARLINKGLVKKTGRKPEYTLTEEGLQLANQLLEENKDKPSINNVIFHKTPITKLSTKTQNDIQVPNSSTSTLNNELKTDVESNTNLIKMQPNSFDIILIIDKNEKNGSSKKHDPFAIYPDLKYEKRSLKVGDFTWVARHKVDGTELVLPYIVERKRMDDLGASIKDGRFHEQKFRLRKCGLDNVIYLIESFEKNKHVGLPLPSLLQALANTRIQDGFKVYTTDSLAKTNRFLAMMTKRLDVEFKDKILHGTNADPINGLLMTFDYFNKSSTKSKPLTVTEMFIKMLLQMKGMSVEKALAITKVYKTPKSLITAYENCSVKEAQALLSNLKYGDLNRNVGPTLSLAVFHLFTS